MTEVEWFDEPGEDPVVLVDSDASWEATFEVWRSRLDERLGPVAVRIEHIGSTAIRGLVAKPVVDVLVGVRDVSDEAAYRPALEALGVPLRAREGDHRFFRPTAGEAREVHVHVCETGGRWERDHLLFRDYLRAHPDVAAAYASLKQRLASELGQDRERYTDAKRDFITDVLAGATTWADQTGWHP